jgi:hypothetical protein
MPEEMTEKQASLTAGYQSANRNSLPAVVLAAATNYFDRLRSQLDVRPVWDLMQRGTGPLPGRISQEQADQ